MEQQVGDARVLVSRGTELLLQGKVQEAGAEFSRAAQLDPQLAPAHLGLAEVNLALGAYGIVYVACRHVLDLAPQSADGAVARAILYVLDRRYEAAVSELETAEQLDPGRAYVHAMRGYALRQLGRNGEAALAEAKSARLSGNRELGQLFPKVDLAPAGLNGANGAGVNGQPSPFAQPAPPAQQQPIRVAGPRPWSERSPIERRMVRVRFATANNAIVTMSLIAVNVAVYVLCGLLSRDFFQPLHINQYLFNTQTGVLVAGPNPLYTLGLLQGANIVQDPTQAYRLLTSMFLHEGILHIGVNMWSLYAVGVITERIFGSGKYAVIYFGAGLVGGVAQAVLAPYSPGLGASGAIFGIFGAFGAFILLRRRQLGPAANFYIGQWIFFLVINVVFTLSVPNIAVGAHFGGLIAGFLLGALFVLAANRKRASGRVA